MPSAAGKDPGSGFRPVSDEDWLQEAAGDAADRVPAAEVEAGLATRWLYVPADSLAPDPGGRPGHSPFVRGTREGTPWRHRQAILAPRRALAAEQVAEEVANGVTEIELRLDRTSRHLRRPEDPGHEAERGLDGMAISALEDLEEVLAGAGSGEVGVSLDAGAAAPAASGLLIEHWRRHDLMGEASGSLGIDPLGSLAAGEPLGRRPAEEIAIAAALAGDVDAAVGPDAPVTVLRVGTSPYVDAGATAAWEIAIATATGVEYLRACDRIGVDPERAARRIELDLTSGPDQFVEIAKLRAMRRMWARVLESSGVPAERRRSPLHARTSNRMMAAVDPWTNMLRATASAFAAAVGGVDGFTVAAFDRAYVDWPGREPEPDLAGSAPPGEPSAGPGWLGRRMARNTQHILEREAGLGQLADPAGGSWYVESVTDDLAGHAWDLFQRIERDGGATAVLEAGKIHERLEDLATERRSEIATRYRLMTGVNIYPHLGGDRVRVEPADREQIAREDAQRHGSRPEPEGADRLAGAVQRVLAGEGAGSGLLEALGDFAGAGATFEQAAAEMGSGGYSIEPLPIARDAEPFEHLRAAAAAHASATGERPRILLACLGPIARHVSAVNWARSFFEAGGIEAVTSVELATGARPEAVDDPAEVVVPEPGELGEALERSGTSLAAICAGRDETVEAINEAAAALSRAGAGWIYLADATDEQSEGSEADEVVADGVDMIEVLGAALRRCGVQVDEEAS